jgi:hypothetical protein
MTPPTSACDELAVKPQQPGTYVPQYCRDNTGRNKGKRRMFNGRVYVRRLINYALHGIGNARSYYQHGERRQKLDRRRESQRLMRRHRARRYKSRDRVAAVMESVDIGKTENDYCQHPECYAVLHGNSPVPERPQKNVHKKVPECAKRALSGIRRLRKEIRK